MNTRQLASEAVNAALRCSNYKPDNKRLKDVYADAVEAEIALIYAAIDNGMNPEDHARARETLKQLMKNGRRYSYSTALEQAA
ncbi:hypothetical protein C0J08_15140 [Marinomonas sp. CT5]|uniref:hypothetical protein n=1 Tax=Marinomonas sp. CT5 TaxID=2066133 RepID=UPI001BAEB4D8|nr:hypothetical protein [Marinomonas sp. CT5]QUX96651.1 hypothetical protein C0J08_15140 [Marinomonas sp. CT5]